eukprot:3281104-Rhodomonas_salina.3
MASGPRLPRYLALLYAAMDPYPMSVTRLVCCASCGDKEGAGLVPPPNHEVRTPLAYAATHTASEQERDRINAFKTAVQVSTAVRVAPYPSSVLHSTGAYAGSVLHSA